MVLVAAPITSHRWTQALETSEVDLVSSACVRLVPNLIKAAGREATTANGAHAASALRKLTPTALSGFPGEDAGSQAAAAALLRAHCEGIACCQDSSGAITHQVAAAVGALHYGLVALEASGADAETGQRRRQRRHAERHPLAGYHALGTLVQHAAAALAAVVLQCAAAEAVAFARSRAGEHAADHQHPHSLPKHYCQQQPAGPQQQERGQQRTSRPGTQAAGATTLGRPGAVTLEDLVGYGVLHLLSITIVEACHRSWLSDALMPAASALLAVGTYVSEVPAAGPPDGHRAAAAPHRGPAHQQVHVLLAPETQLRQRRPQNSLLAGLSERQRQLPGGVGPWWMPRSACTVPQSPGGTTRPAPSLGTTSSISPERRQPARRLLDSC